MASQGVPLGRGYPWATRSWLEVQVGSLVWICQCANVSIREAAWSIWDHQVSEQRRDWSMIMPRGQDAPASWQAACELKVQCALEDLATGPAPTGTEWHASTMSLGFYHFNASDSGPLAALPACWYLGTWTVPLPCPARSDGCSALLELRCLSPAAARGWASGSTWAQLEGGVGTAGGRSVIDSEVPGPGPGSGRDRAFKVSSWKRRRRRRARCMVHVSGGESPGATVSTRCPESPVPEEGPGPGDARSGSFKV
jgi:hypothetical protein